MQNSTKTTTKKETAAKTAAKKPATKTTTKAAAKPRATKTVKTADPEVITKESIKEAVESKLKRYYVVLFSPGYGDGFLGDKEVRHTQPVGIQQMNEFSNTQ